MEISEIEVSVEEVRDYLNGLTFRKHVVPTEF